MPFYCGKRSAGIWVVLGPRQSRPPHHLGGAHKHGATYSSHRAPSTYSSEYALRFLSRLRPRICQQLLLLATKDYSDRLLAGRNKFERSRVIVREISNMVLFLHESHVTPHVQNRLVPISLFRVLAQTIRESMKARHGGVGVCPSNAILLRQTICRHLRRSRPETVPAASPSQRRAQTWCDVFVAPCALNVFPREGALSRRAWGGRVS